MSLPNALRGTLASLLLIFMLAPASVFATSKHGKGQPAHEAPPKPPTYEQAVEEEQQLLDNPAAKMLSAANLQFDDDALLTVIDQADHEGKASDLPEAVAQRLSEWRQHKEDEAAIKNAPWEHGPVSVSLEGPATLDVPKGYKYLAPKEVAAIKEFHEDSDRGKAMLLSEDESVMLAIELVQTGHYDASELQLDPDKVLLAIAEHYHNPLMQIPQPGETPQLLNTLADSPSWLQPPHYDEKQQMLSWANTLPSPLPSRTNVLRLGRTWTAEIRAAGSMESDALLERARAVATGLHFQAGEDYADTKPDDARATTSMTDVISGGPNPMQQMISTGLAASMQQDQERRDSEFGRLLLRLGGPVLGLIALAIGAANRKKTAAASDDTPPTDEQNKPDAPTA